MTEHSKPAPGPWTVFNNPTSNYGLEVRADVPVKAKQVICRVGGPDREANARLIAAAPELLDAVHNLMDILRDYGAIDNLDIRIREARAAIAKVSA